jgi:phage shock protein A
MRAAEVALDPVVADPVGAAVELRRQAVDALSCQRRLREEADTIRTQAEEIERQASRAFARGEDLVARQILARGICTLKARDALEAQLAMARGRVVGLLRAMVRTEDRAWRERP